MRKKYATDFSFLYSYFLIFIIFICGAIACEVVGFIVMLIVDPETADVAVASGFKYAEIVMSVALALGILVGIFIGPAKEKVSKLNFDESAFALVSSLFFKRFKNLNYIPKWYVVIVRIFYILFSSGICIGAIYGSIYAINWASDLGRISYDSAVSLKCVFLLGVPSLAFASGLVLMLHIGYLVKIKKYECPKCHKLSMECFTITDRVVSEEEKYIQGNYYTKNEKVSDITIGDTNVEVYKDVLYKNPDYIKKIVKHNAQYYHECGFCGYKTEHHTCEYDDVSKKDV